MFYTKSGIYMEKNDEYQFDPNDWQGRRKKQVEYSYKVVYWTFTLGIIWTILALIFA